MFWIHWQRETARKFCAQLGSLILMLILMVGLGSCSDRANLPFNINGSASTAFGNQLAEVSPPAEIQTLKQALEAYHPQVSILSPRADEVLQDNTVSVKLRVRDLPLFKNTDLGLGPHLHLILDNEPYRAVYDVDQPVVLSDLTPGTHTLRVFASRPWHESFKNEGAYAQTTFHVFTQTHSNRPESNQPLLTYSRPTGTYGAEPIMLDFYVTNGQLATTNVDVADAQAKNGQIRCTIDGQSFVVDQWQPIYLKGFKPGKNWVELEYLDGDGNPIESAFNTTLRVVTYEPNGQDTLSKLVRGDLTAAEAQGIVDPNYPPPQPELIPTPEAPPVPLAPTLDTTPDATPEPTATPAPVVVPPTVMPSQPQVKQPLAPTEQEKVNKKEEATATPDVDSETVPRANSDAESNESGSTSLPDLSPAPVERSRPQQKFFDRFRQRPASSPAPVPEAPSTLPEVVEAPSLDAPTVETPAASPSEISLPTDNNVNRVPLSTQLQNTPTK